MINLTDCAIEQAQQSWHSSFKHGAILFNGKHIISKGYNKPVISAKPFHSIHAEMAAIKDAKSKIKYSKFDTLSMIVVRINKSGNLCFSKPCSHCQNIMKNCGVQKCFFSTNTGDINYMYL